MKWVFLLEKQLERRTWKHLVFFSRVKNLFARITIPFVGTIFECGQQYLNIAAWSLALNVVGRLELRTIFIVVESFHSIIVRSVRLLTFNCFAVKLLSYLLLHIHSFIFISHLADWGVKLKVIASHFIIMKITPVATSYDNECRSCLYRRRRRRRRHQPNLLDTNR